MKKIGKIALTYDDVLLVPQYSEILPAQTNIETFFTKKIKLTIPISTAPMDTVTESGMAIAVGKLGGIGIIHKNLSIEKQADEVDEVKKNHCLAGAAAGVGADHMERVDALVAAGLDVLVVDSAHGHSKRVLEVVKGVKKKYKNLQVVGGNVATAKGALALIKAGVDAVKVGMGPGSICTTRVVTGCGMPQVEAILRCVDVCRKYKVPLIADGGIQFSGDVAKALALGASSVMMGAFFAGCEESPGDVIEVNEKKYKIYRGMGSLPAMEAGSKDRYGQDSEKFAKKLVPEGIEGRVLYRGKMEDVVVQIVGGLRAALGYCGSKNLNEFYKKSELIQISQAGQEENHPHDVEITKKAPNY